MTGRKKTGERVKREGEIGGDRKGESGLIEERKRERRELRRDTEEEKRVET